MRKKHTATRSEIKTSLRLLLLAGITGPFLSQILQYIGLSLTAAGETLLLLNFTPVFAVVLATPLLGEKITADKVGGLILATLGASLIVLGGTPIESSIGPIRLIGDLIIIVSTLLFALNGIVGKMVVKTIDSVSVSFYSSLLAVPFIWTSAFLLEDTSILLSLSSDVWLAVTWVAIVNTFIAFVLYYESMKYIEASRVQIALNLIGVWGVLMSVLILGESTSIIQILGGVITIIGVIIAQKMQSRGGTKMTIVTRNHDPEETPPLVMKRNDILHGERGRTEYSGWILCEHPTGTTGWVPEHYLQEIDDSSSSFKSLRDYSSYELPVQKGIRVEIMFTESAWAWVKTETDVEGWVPLENLDLKLT